MENEEKIRLEARRRLEEQLKQYRVQRHKERVSGWRSCQVMDGTSFSSFCPRRPCVSAASALSEHEMSSIRQQSYCWCCICNIQLHVCGLNSQLRLAAKHQNQTTLFILKRQFSFTQYPVHNRHKQPPSTNSYKYYTMQGSDTLYKKAQECTIGKVDK